jgi:UDP-2,3-diacylglucosamine hydrolase
MFTGNHDMWMFSYFPEELGIDIIRKPIETQINGLKLMIGHGDGLGPGDYGYKFIKRVFASKVCQWLFARLHPNFAIGLGLFFSRRSRLARGDSDYHYKGEDKECLLVYAKEILKLKHFDFFIFGHRHFPLDLEIAENSHYINLGDWINNFTYAELDGQKLTLKNFK